MIKIVKSLPKQEVITVNTLRDDVYVGIKWAYGGKSWIVRTDDECFKGMCIGDRTINGWEKNSLSEYVERALDQKGTEAYYFGNDKAALIKFLTE